MDCRTEVYVKKLGVEPWLNNYCFHDKFQDLCKPCPDYGKVWSCPPKVPAIKGYLDNYKEVFVIAVKVIYDKAVRRSADTPEKVEKVRKETYSKVKRILLEILLYLEKENSGSFVLAPGRCEQCEQCSRIQGLPCIKPERMRYSFAAFGFDFTKLSKELFDVDLVWSTLGLPEYNLAIAALLTT
jgi:predicted metal-binding protein